MRGSLKTKGRQRHRWHHRVLHAKGRRSAGATTPQGAAGKALRRRKEWQRRYIPTVLPGSPRRGKISGIRLPPWVIALIAAGILTLLVFSPESLRRPGRGPVPSIPHYPNTPPLASWMLADDVTALYYGEIIEASQAQFEAPHLPASVLAFYREEMQKAGWTLYHTEAEEGVERKLYFIVIRSSGRLFQRTTTHIVTVGVEPSAADHTLVTLVKVVSQR